MVGFHAVKFHIKIKVSIQNNCFFNPKKGKTSNFLIGLYFIDEIPLTSEFYYM